MKPTCDYRVKIFSPTSNPLGRERNWRLNQWPLADELIIHAYIIKLYKEKNKKDAVQAASR